MIYHRKLVLVSTCAVLTTAAVVSLRGVRNEKYHDSKVKAGEIRRPWDVIALHVSRPQYLTIGGHTYRGIRGTAPYYLDVPSLNSIFFVTQGNNYWVTFHVFNLVTKEDIQVEAGTSGFGWGIGGNRKAGDKYTDYIEGVASNRLALTIRSGSWKETMVVNLTTKVIELRETVYFDSAGQVTNRSIQKNVN